MCMELKNKCMVMCMELKNKFSKVTKYIIKYFHTMFLYNRNRVQEKVVVSNRPKDLRVNLIN